MFISLVVTSLVVVAVVTVFLFLKKTGSHATQPAPSLLDILPQGMRHLTLFSNRGDLTLVENCTPLMRYEDINILRPEQAYIHALGAAVDYVNKHGSRPICLYASFNLGSVVDYALEGAVGGFTQTEARLVVVHFDVPTQQFKVFFDSEADESFALKQFEQAASAGRTPLTTW